MDCPSSDEGAFNTPLHNGKHKAGTTIHTTSVSTHEMNQKYESDEIVFSASPPRGPLARLVKGPSDATSSIETTLDMIKISLKDSEEEHMDSSLKDNMDEYKDTSDNKTTLTVISSETSKQNNGNINVPNLDIEKQKEAKIAPEYNIPSEDEYSSLDRTIIDSELPSLPTDNAVLSGKEPEHKNEDLEHILVQPVLSAEQSYIDTEPISLSDIKLIENSQ